MRFINEQNPDYETESWSFVVEGKPKPYGQHLIKINKEDAPENEVEVRLDLHLLHGSRMKLTRKDRRTSS